MNNLLRMSRYTKHLIFTGLKVIGFILGWGVMFVLIVPGIAELIKSGFFGVYSEQAMYIVPAIPTIGLIILIVWVLRFASIDPRCPHCNKKLFDNIIQKESTK